MNKQLLTLLLGATTAVAFAQTDPAPAAAPDATPAPKPWLTELVAGINLNQAAYSANWQSGGTSSIASSMFLNGKANRKWEHQEWTNEIQLQYGNIRNKGQDMRKNSDRIFVESKYSHQLHKHWSLFASVTLMTQFDAGYEYYKLKDSTGKEFGDEKSRRISGFMSPGYISESFGLEYKPVSYFSAQFGVGGLRQTFVTDQTLYDQYAPTDDKYNVIYGVERGQNMRNQIVFQFVANFDKEIMKNMFLKARYLAIADYENLTGTGIVSRLDASLTAKVNRYINVNLTGVVLYDYDQDVDVQYSQILSLGVLYGISNQPKK
jgi:hypothetical protein